MKNTIYLDLFVLVLFVSLFTSPSEALYKKKLMVGKFENPSGWDKPYDPGNMISELLRQELMHRENVQLISISNNMQKLMDDSDSSTDNNYVEPTIFNSTESMNPKVLLIQNSDTQMRKDPSSMDRMMPMEDDPLWPTKLGKKVHKSTFTKVRGKVIKFLPDNKIGESAITKQSNTRETAEVQVHVELVQNSTGRVLHERTFRKVSHLGTKPFSVDRMSLKEVNGSSELSSMNSALNSLKRAVGEFISEKIETLPLEGEIIAVKKKEIPDNNRKKTLVEEEILVNIGSSNGVRIGDLFQVNAVGLAVSDPYTAADLGDVYVKIGVIQILEA